MKPLLQLRHRVFNGLTEAITSEQTFGRGSVKMVWLPQISIALSQVQTWHGMVGQQNNYSLSFIAACPVVYVWTLAIYNS